jgi:Flp pilus assembly protein TadB
VRERVKLLDRRKGANQGVGDGLSRSFELLVTPALFAGIGLLADRWLGVTPILTVVLGVFGVVGTFLSFWYRYDASMRREEAELAARRAAAPVGGPASVSGRAA